VNLPGPEIMTGGTKGIQDLIIGKDFNRLQKGVVSIRRHHVTNRLTVSRERNGRIFFLLCLRISRSPRLTLVTVMICNMSFISIPAQIGIFMTILIPIIRAVKRSNRVDGNNGVHRSPNLAPFRKSP
jgi:hypothetical protein